MTSNLVTSSSRSQNGHYTFRQLVEQTMSQLEGAFACVFKSTKYPGECVATRSPQRDIIHRIKLKRITLYTSSEVFVI